jgi:hypothetical protein
LFFNDRLRIAPSLIPIEFLSFPFPQIKSNQFNRSACERDQPEAWPGAETWRGTGPSCIYVGRGLDMFVNCSGTSDIHPYSSTGSSTGTSTGTSNGTIPDIDLIPEAEDYTARTITISFFMALAAIVSMVFTMFIISRLCPLWCKSDGSYSTASSSKFESPTFVSV